MKKLFVLLALSFICFSYSSQAALKLIESEGEAGNFIYEQDKSALVSSVFLVLPVGSNNDPVGKEGLTNLSFLATKRGTLKKSRLEFVSQLEELGASIDIDIGHKRTIVQLYSISENLEEAITLMAEALLEPAFPEKDMAALFKEQIAKLEQSRASARSMLFRAYRLALFEGTPLRHPPTGTVKALKSLKTADLVQHLQANLNSKSVLFAASTNHSKAKLLKWLERSFQKLKDGTKMSAKEVSIPKVSGRHFVIVPRKKATITEVVLGHPSITSEDPNNIALNVANFSFGRNPFTSRVWKKIREDNGWAYGAYSSFNYMDIPRRYGSAFSLYANPASVHAEKAIMALINLYDEYGKSGVTEKELNFSRKALGNSYAFKHIKAKQRLFARLYRYSDGVPIYNLQEYREIINGLSVDGLNAMIKAAHDSSNLVIVASGDERKLRAIAKKIPGIKSVRVIKDPVLEVK